MDVSVIVGLILFLHGIAYANDDCIANLGTIRIDLKSPQSHFQSQLPLRLSSIMGRLTLDEGAEVLEPYIGSALERAAVRKIVREYFTRLDQDRQLGRDLAMAMRDARGDSRVGRARVVFGQALLNASADQIKGGSDRSQLFRVFQELRIIQDQELQSTQKDSWAKAFDPVHLGRQWLSLPARGLSAIESKAMFIESQMGTELWRGKSLIDSVPSGERGAVEKIIVEKFPKIRLYKYLAKLRAILPSIWDQALAESLETVFNIQGAGVKKAFSMDRTLTTQLEYVLVVGTNYSYHGQKYVALRLMTEHGISDAQFDPNMPVDNLSRGEESRFFAKKNEAVRFIGMNANWRRPTESEYELVSRSRTYSLAPEEAIDPRTVAQRKPNELGLYDLDGYYSTACEDEWQDQMPDEMLPMLVVDYPVYFVRRGGKTQRSVDGPWGGDRPSKGLRQVF